MSYADGASQHRSFRCGRREQEDTCVSRTCACGYACTCGDGWAVGHGTVPALQLRCMRGSDAHPVGA